MFKTLVLVAIVATASATCNNNNGLYEISENFGSSNCRKADLQAAFPALLTVIKSTPSNYNYPSAPVAAPIATSYPTAAPAATNYPAPAPVNYPPRTIAESLDCKNSVVRPHVSKQAFQVPAIRKEIQTVVKPVVETYQYDAKPGAGSYQNGVNSVSNSPLPTPADSNLSHRAIAEFLRTPSSSCNSFFSISELPSRASSTATAAAPSPASFAPQTACPQSYPTANFAPRVISETVVLNNGAQRVVNVPSVRQEIRTVVKPVVESCRYRAQPAPRPQVPACQSTHVYQSASVQETPIYQSATVQEVPIHQSTPVHETRTHQSSPVYQSRSAPIRQVPIYQSAPIRQGPVYESAPIQKVPVYQSGPVQEAPIYQSASACRSAHFQEAPIPQSTPIRQSAPIYQSTPIHQSAPVQEAPIYQSSPIRQSPSAPIRQVPSYQSAPIRQVPVYDSAPIQKVPVYQTAPIRQGESSANAAYGPNYFTDSAVNYNRCN